MTTKRRFRPRHEQALLWRFGEGAGIIERGAIIPPDGSPRGNGCSSTKGDVSRAGGEGPSPDAMVRWGQIDRALRALALPTWREVLALGYGDAGAIVTEAWDRTWLRWRAVAHLTELAKVSAVDCGIKIPAPKSRPVKGEIWDQRERDLGGPAPQRFVRLLLRATPRALGADGRELLGRIERASKGLLASAEEAFVVVFDDRLAAERHTDRVAAWRRANEAQP